MIYILAFSAKTLIYIHHIISQSVSTIEIGGRAIATGIVGIFPCALLRYPFYYLKARSRNYLVKGV